MYDAGILILLFLASGVSALIYEVVWLQLLQLVIGSSAVSMAVLLGTYMGGLCLGSVGFARLFSRQGNPLRVYAVLEAGTGVCGLAALAGLPLVENLYFSAAENGMAGIGLRGLACAVCLLPATMLMGATLPALARCIRASSLGLYYAANIAGGVLGCLLSGFWLLPRFDMTVAVYVAAGLNGGIAVLALIASGRHRVPVGEKRMPGECQRIPRAVFAVTALSGFSALGAEVIWTRLLSLTLGPTVYTFSLILAVFLAGLGIGSALVPGLLARYRGHARGLLAASQLLLLGGIWWAGYLIADRLPRWNRETSVHAEPWRGFLFDLACSAAALLPAAVLWGASFPLAVRSALREGEDSGHVTGEIYAANTAGAIAGALLFSLVMIPWLGSQDSGRLLVALTGIAALTACAALTGYDAWPRRRMQLVLALATVAAVWAMPAIPWKLIAFGRRLSFENGPWKNLYTAEGRNSLIAYSEWVDKRRFFHVAGKVEASSTPADMRLQRMLGHVPALLHTNPISVLIVGCGAGVTAGSFVVHPEVQRITLCEIEPLIPPASDRFFGKENHGVVRDPRTHLVSDDARHYVRTAREKFDIITSDPIHPWVKGAASLYSKEYFEACRAHLKPGGLVTQWVPLYSSDFETVKSEIATFFEVFPDAAVWGNVDDFDQGYDLVLLGSTGPLRIDVDATQARVMAAPRVAESLGEVGFRSAADLLGMYASRPADLREWLRGAAVNRDRNLRLQYLAGLSLNRSVAGAIYGQMQQRSPFPEGLFTGSPAGIAAVRRVFDAWRSL